jgi:hypothetical protein
MSNVVKMRLKSLVRRSGFPGLLQTPRAEARGYPVRVGSELVQCIGDAADQASLLGQQENSAGAYDPKTSGDRNRAVAKAS